MSASTAHPVDPAVTGDSAPAVKPPLYWRLLRLKTLRPNGWQRAMLVEGVLTVAVILVLADVASAWTLLVLPLASMVLVKANDMLATSLHPHSAGHENGPGHANGAGPAGMAPYRQEQRD